MTGLAQVLQPPDTDLNSVRRKLAYDLYYVDHLGFWLDVKIGFATILLFLAIPGRAIAAMMKFPYERPHLRTAEVPS